MATDQKISDMTLITSASILSTDYFTLVKASDLTNKKATVVESAKTILANLASGAISETELGYLNTVSSNIQTQLNAKINTTVLIAALTGSYNTATLYSTFNGNAALSADSIQFVVPYPFTLSLLNCRVQTQTSSTTTTITIMKNGVATAMTCSFITTGSISTGLTASDLVNTVSFVAGDTISIKMVTNNTYANLTVSALATF